MIDLQLSTQCSQCKVAWKDQWKTHFLWRNMASQNKKKNANTGPTNTNTQSSPKCSLDPRDFPQALPSGNPLGLVVQNLWTQEISQDFPRPSRFPSGLGKSWASGMDLPIPPSSWWSTDTFLPIHDPCFNHQRPDRDISNFESKTRRDGMEQS